jgi:hypothetical protein
MQLGIDLFKNEKNSVNRKVVIHVFIYIDMHVSEAHYGGGLLWARKCTILKIHFELFSRYFFFDFI